MLPLPTSICSTLHHAVDLLAAGKVPQQVSKYMAGASVIALTKEKPNCAPEMGIAYRLRGLSAHLEEGTSWSIEKPKSRPADILVANWDRGFSAAFDVSVTSPLNPLHIVEAGISPGAAAKATEERKHRNNDAKCEELGWRCIPMVVESYGCWGTEVRQALSQLAS
ncbi:hypothetical protein EMCRGX_G033036 [Ephydatia muelleri]